MPIFLEICCGSIDDALQAQAGGAQRVELCAALFLGGLTPSIGTVQHARQHLTIPIMAMVRPRGGGFCYTDAEFATMERDAEALIANGADGIVFGILNQDGAIDLARTRRLREIAGSRQSVFHRAFDVTSDPFRALDELVDLGITRVLTSGQQDTVPEGADLIRRLIEYSAGRIEVLPGGGIKPYNLADVIARTGCRQVHLTAFKTVADSSTRHHPHVTFGGALHPAEDRFQMTDADLVCQIAQKLL
ncbi:MAG TPA: copper homeostasis protein CutC [Terriglobales bacterium]|nr:copper homeostasis protein CutC [Terriglobales bacterium]